MFVFDSPRMSVHVIFALTPLCVSRGVDAGEVIVLVGELVVHFSL